MASITWTIPLEDGDHTLELRHDPQAGRSQIYFDGSPLAISGGLTSATGSKQRFAHHGHSFTLEIQTTEATPMCQLRVDGQVIASAPQDTQGDAPAPTGYWSDT